MAEQIGAKQHIFRYQNVTILKDQTLGHGSYGAVYKARCDQLECAAKVLHPTIVDRLDPGSGRILQRFQQECDFLNHIRHPHIVQYLGVCEDPESNLPVLLMELLDESLTKMLERSQHPISYNVQVDLCHDVSLAVSYLHSNGIIHRDLSGNNVLVIAGRRAKVTDFGMSKLVGSDRHMTPLTVCPGTLVYMSPESLKEPPSYTEKLDVFSEGVIMIQVCTGQFPDPGPAMKERKDPQSPVGTIQVPVPEPERRKKHIDLIDPIHPLLPIATECLEYREQDRPSAEELCQRLGALKEKPEYIESRQHMILATPEVVRTLQQERDELTTQIEEKEQSIVTKDQQIEAKSQEVERLGTQVQDQNLSLEKNKQAITELQEENEQLRRELKEKTDPLKEIEFRWTYGGKAPFKSQRGSSVVSANAIYFSSYENITTYDLSTGSWNTLPKCPQKYGSLAVVQGLLTVVGGKQTSDERTTNKLVCLNERKEWIEQFPPMPTARRHTTATTYQNHLIIAGGTKSGNTVTDSVEILKADTLVWSTAASLPCPFTCASATICTVGNDCFYMLGGNGQKGACRSVFSCSLQKLLQPYSLLDEPKVWQYDIDIPVYYSTCVTVHGQLVAVGGQDKGGKKTTAVYKYDPINRFWSAIHSHMMTARSLAYVAVSTNQLIVVGGFVYKGDRVIDTIEIAELANR